MPDGGYHILKNLVINPLVFPNSLFGGCPRTLFQPPQSPNHGGSLYWGTPPKPPAGRILHFFSDSLKEGDLKLGDPPPDPRSHHLIRGSLAEGILLPGFSNVA